MRKLLMLLFYMPFSVFFAAAQSASDAVYQKIIAADSVTIVSHITTYGPAEERPGRHSPFYVLVNKNVLNIKILKERYSLSRAEIDSLARIITEINSDSIVQTIGCFIPHHGIIIYKQKKLSFFDICFGCRHFVTSKDIDISDQLSDKTWLELYRFFRNRKLYYELRGDTIEFD